MKLILAILALILLPSMASAGLLFGSSSKTVVHEHHYHGVAPSAGYSMTYGRSYSAMPSYRTYRVFRGPVQSGYYVPQAPVAAPADPEPAPVQVYSAPVRTYSVQSYAADDAVATKVKHKERHRHGRSKVSHKETSR